ncbi:MAG TPA: hypothetical protein VI685_11495, partial [Candidatus Angelobacter sp.]
MKISLPISRLCLCLLAALLFSVRAYAGLSVTDYRQQLQQLSARVEQLKEHPEQAMQLASDVPDSVTVNANSQEFSFSYDWLKADLKKLQQADAETRAGLLPDMEQRLQNLEQQARAFESSPINLQQNHKKVEEILSRHEFRKSKGPGFLAIWWEKFTRWISDFFDRHPIYGHSGLDLM